MKTLRFMVLWIGLTPLPGCDTPDAASPVLAIQKQAGTQWVTCADSDDCALVGGRDRIRVRAAYEGLSFPASDEPDPPALSIRLDGVEVTSPPAMSSVEDETSLVFESGIYRIPGGTATNLSLRVEGAPGYTAELSGYRISPEAAQVTVTGCDSAPCTSFTAGVGNAHLEVLSWLEPLSKLTVRSRVDGVPVESKETTFGGTTATERIAVVDVPVPRVLVREGTSPRWQLELAAEGIAIPPQDFALAAPTASITVTGCGADDCLAFQSGVGEAVVELKARQLAGSKARLRSILRGNVFAQQEATFEGAGALEPVARFTMPVPSLFLAVGTTATWRLELSGETGSFPSRDITLARPEFAATFLQCKGDGCLVPASSKVTLEASAPANVSTGTVSVRTTIDGVPSDTRGEIDLADVEGERRYGTITLDAPAAGKKLVAKVDFGNGYVQTAQVTTK